MNDIKVPPFTDGQKQLIEMTEKLAEKRGGKICDVDGIDDDITGIIELLEDTISRIEGLTNEEWLRSCNTEQLADVLLEHFEWGLSINAEYCFTEKYVEQNREHILEWLKQPHEDTK